MKNKSIKKLFLTLFLFCCFTFCGVEAYPSADGFKKDTAWQVEADSGWPGASSGRVNYNKGSKEFIYDLEATKQWAWPEIDFFMDFSKAQDLSGFKGILLEIKGKPGQEAYFYLSVEDKNLHIRKPLMHKFLLNGKKQKLFLPFLNFKVGSDWQPRNPGHSPDNGLDKTIACGFHLKGRSGQSGKLILFNLKPLKKALSAYKFVRARPPKFYQEDLNKIKEAGITDSEIIIHAAHNLQKIPPYLYGANWGVWLNLPDEKKVALLKLKLLRAGGPFIDRYDWHNSKYSFPGSQHQLTMASLDEFVAYCRRNGIEPLIQINALGLSGQKDPAKRRVEIAREAAELLRYLNREKKYGVKFFEIGNEPFIWHKVHYDLREKPCSIDEYFLLFKEVAFTLKKEGRLLDPGSEIKIFAPAFCFEDLQFSQIGDFLSKCSVFEKDKKENPQGIRILDVLSFHYFPSLYENMSGRPEKDTIDLSDSAQSWWNNEYVNKYDSHLPAQFKPGILARLKNLIQANYPGTELALTEFNIEADSMVALDPLIKVLYLSDLYGIAAKYQLNYLMQFVLNSSDQYCALLDDLDNLTPLYYPLSLFAENFQGYLLKTENNFADKLNIYACRNANSIVIMVINKTNEKYLTRIKISGNPEETKFIHSFPGFSLTCIRIDSDKGTARFWEYGKEQIENRIESL